MDARAPVRLSPKHFLANVLGAVLAGAGMAGLSGATAGLPVISNPVVDGVLLVAGVGLMAWFFIHCFKRIRVAGQGHSQQANH